MCNEVDIVQSSESLNELPTSQNMHVYRDLSDEATKFRAGEFRGCFFLGGVRGVEGRGQDACKTMS